MYQNHVPVIRDASIASPHDLLGLGAFVLLTIRQPLRRVPRALADVRRHGRQSRWLFGHKVRGFAYLAEHKVSLFAEASAAIDTKDAERALWAFVDVPNLGLVKAGFVAQCLGLSVGCLDTHNLERFGLDAESLRCRKEWSRARKARAIANYLDLCGRFGGAEYLWDSWCAYVADRQLDLFAGIDADSISELHVTAIRQWRN